MSGLLVLLDVVYNLIQSMRYPADTIPFHTHPRSIAGVTASCNRSVADSSCAAGSGP
jgi:hypothetical protein